VAKKDTVKVTFNLKRSYRKLAGRLLWNFIWGLLFRWSPVPFHGWRSFLLRLFGAKIGKKVLVYPSVTVWYPWNLVVGDGSCLGRCVIGTNVVVSQYSYLCTAGHNISDIKFGLLSKPIQIEDNAWIAADAFIGPGVVVENGAVVGARAAVFKNVKAWTVVGGNPAKFIKKRKLRQPGQS
jgi:putative colanic acid biosynthesis acetyltransferase WcaF